MNKMLMERTNLTLEEADEVFESLSVLEEFQKFMRSSNITSIVDTAFSACMSTLQQMTSTAPEDVKEIAEKNLKGFQESKETFVSDFESNFRRMVAGNLLTILDWVHDEEAIRDFVRLEIATSADELTQMQKTAKQIVDQMIMKISKDYILCTYAGYIPKGLSNASQYVMVGNENGENVIVPKNVLGIA